MVEHSSGPVHVIHIVHHDFGPHDLQERFGGGAAGGFLKRGNPLQSEFRIDPRRKIKGQLLQQREPCGRQFLLQQPPTDIDQVGQQRTALVQFKAAEEIVPVSGTPARRRVRRGRRGREDNPCGGAVACATGRIIETGALTRVGVDRHAAGRAPRPRCRRERDHVIASALEQPLRVRRVDLGIFPKAPAVARVRRSPPLAGLEVVHHDGRFTLKPEILQRGRLESGNRSALSRHRTHNRCAARANDLLVMQLAPLPHRGPREGQIGRARAPHLAHRGLGCLPHQGHQAVLRRTALRGPTEDLETMQSGAEIHVLPRPGRLLDARLQVERLAIDTHLHIARKTDRGDPGLARIGRRHMRQHVDRTGTAATGEVAGYGKRRLRYAGPVAVVYRGRHRAQAGQPQGISLAAAPRLRAEQCAGRQPRGGGPQPQTTGRLDVQNHTPPGPRGLKNDAHAGGPVLPQHKTWHYAPIRRHDVRLGIRPRQYAPVGDVHKIAGRFVRRGARQLQLETQWRLRHVPRRGRATRADDQQPRDDPVNPSIFHRFCSIHHPPRSPLRAINCYSKSYNSPPPSCGTRPAPVPPRPRPRRPAARDSLES